MFDDTGDLTADFSFSESGEGGNPAGVYLTDRLPAQEEMQRISSWLYDEVFTIRQGENMRRPSWVLVSLTNEPGESISRKMPGSLCGFRIRKWSKPKMEQPSA